MTIHRVTAVFCHAFYILFESTSYIRLKVGAAKRDVIKGKGSNSTVLARSFVVVNSESESGTASEASLSYSPISFEESYTDQTRGNTPEQSGYNTDTATIETYSLSQSWSVESSTSADLVGPEIDISRLDDTDW